MWTQSLIQLLADSLERREQHRRATNTYRLELADVVAHTREEISSSRRLLSRLQAEEEARSRE